MNIEELKKYLETRRANCEKAKARNLANNHSLGDFNKIGTAQGLSTERMLNGKIKLIDDILERLNEPTQAPKESAQPISHIDFLKREINTIKAEIERLQNELAELETELAEKMGYKTLDDLGIEY